MEQRTTHWVKKKGEINANSTETKPHEFTRQNEETGK